MDNKKMFKNMCRFTKAANKVLRKNKTSDIEEYHDLVYFVELLDGALEDNRDLYIEQEEGPGYSQQIDRFVKKISMSMVSDDISGAGDKPSTYDRMTEFHIRSRIFLYGMIDVIRYINNKRICE